MSDKDYSELIENACGGYYCDEVIGHIDCRDGVDRTPLVTGDSFDLAYVKRLLQSNAGLAGRIDDCEEVLADYRRNVRLIDTILHGEDGAAKQASMCDIIGPIERLVKRVNELEAANVLLTDAGRQVQAEADRLASENQFLRSRAGVSEEGTACANCHNPVHAFQIPRLENDLSTAHATIAQLESERLLIDEPQIGSEMPAIAAQAQCELTGVEELPFAGAGVPVGESDAVERRKWVSDGQTGDSSGNSSLNIHAQLVSLRDDVASIIRLAIENRETINDAVNWASLCCEDAQYVVTSDGATYYRVCVSEASPDAGKLREFIADQLILANWGEVEVETEW